MTGPHAEVHMQIFFSLFPDDLTRTFFFPFFAEVHMQNLSRASRRTRRRQIQEQTLPEQALLASSETQLIPAQTRVESLEKAAEYTTDKDRSVSQYCGAVLAAYITPYRI